MPGKTVHNDDATKVEKGAWKNGRPEWEIAIIEQALKRVVDRAAPRPKKEDPSPILKVSEEDKLTILTHHEAAQAFRACATELVAQISTQSINFRGNVRKFNDEKLNAGNTGQRIRFSAIEGIIKEAFEQGEAFLDMFENHERCYELAEAIEKGTPEGREAFARLVMISLDIRNGDLMPENFEPKFPAKNLVSRLNKINKKTLAPFTKNGPPQG